MGVCPGVHSGLEPICAPVDKVCSVPLAYGHSCPLPPPLRPSGTGLAGLAGTHGMQGWGRLLSEVTVCASSRGSTAWLVDDQARWRPRVQARQVVARPGAPA